MNYAIEIVTPPASEPVSLNELKAHLRATNTNAEDAVLSSYITAAREMFEMYTGRVCVATTFRQHVHQLSRPVALVKAPVTSIVSVNYYDADDVLQTASGVQSDLVSTPSWVWLDEYPSLSENKSPVAQVEFVAGWTTPPQMVKQAIMLLAGHYFRQREAYTSTSFELRDLPMGFRAVCDQFQTGLVGYANW